MNIMPAMDTKTYRRKILKICVNCKQPLAVNSTWYCADCLYKNAEAHRRWYYNLSEERRREVNDKNRKR